MGWPVNGLVDELAAAAADLLDAAAAARLMPRVTSTRRSRSEQRRLYNRYLAGTAGFPVAPPGFSAHEYGEAFDMVVTPMDALADVGYTWQQWGGGWNPADAVHFELPGASDRAKSAGLQSEGSSKIAGYINSLFLTIGPWWSPLNGANLLKGAVHIEKSLGFDAAIDWVWKH